MKVKTSLILCLILAAGLLSGIACQLTSPEESKQPLTADSVISDLPAQLTPSQTHLAPTEESEDQTLRQWAVEAVDKFDSEDVAYTLGAPNAEACEITGDEEMWTYQSEYLYEYDTSDYIQFFYAEPVLPTEVNIHLTYTHSDIVGITLLDLEGEPHEIFRGEPKDLTQCPSVLTLAVESVTVPVYSIRVDLDSLDPDAYGITAIDAVELVGFPLEERQPTPVPTPYLTMSSLGFNASQVPEGYVYFEIFDNNANISLTHSECDAFSYNLSDTERIIRFFSCDDSTEIWLYLPPEESFQSTPLNSYATVPTAKVFYDGKYIPAMEGELWVDQTDNTTMTGVLEFKGFDPENQVDYYRIVAVFNQIPISEAAAQKPGDMIVQWAEGVDVSSELSPTDNAAHHALGTSDTWEDCSTAITAWKPAGSAEQEWIEVYFIQPVIPAELNILFTETPAAIAEVNLMTSTDFFPLDLTIGRILPGCPTTLAFDALQEIQMAVVGVQILFASTPNPPGVDAVQLIGIIPE